MKVRLRARDEAGNIIYFSDVMEDKPFTLNDVLFEFSAAYALSESF